MKTSKITINPKALLRVLLITSLLFVLVHIFLQVVSGISDKYIFRMLTPWFDLDEERNIPTLYATFLDNRVNKTNRYYWSLLSFIFLFLSTDETLSFHERLINPVTDLLGKENIPGIFHFAWVIPVLILMVFFGLYFRSFYMSLNKKTRLNFLISFILYAGGALGMEMIGSQYSALHGEDNFMYKILTTIEESLELAGTVYFIYTLVVYIADFFGDIEFNITGADEGKRK
jgi:hypothetical protein